MDKEFLRQIDQANELISERQPLGSMTDETLICECFCVSAGDIRNTCGMSQVVDLDLLRATFGLGTGCQGCFKKLDYWVDRIFPS